MRPSPRPVPATLLSLLLLLPACRGDEQPEPPRHVSAAGEIVAEAPGTRGEDADREVVRQRLAWARSERLDTLPPGDLIARLAETFVGTTYTPGTLDVDGPEALVINLRELDCVTFIENVLALAHMVRSGADDFATFEAALTRVRYRGGRLAGYPSRLHYFSEWIFDGEAKGLLRDITAELGGVRDPEPVNFMTSNADAYPQLTDARNVEAIRGIEAALTGRPRFYIPQDRIAAVEARIRDGDIIAARSTIAGLDIAHTGFALWRDGRLHLLHAPLVGSHVEISERPLAERIRRIPAQDGIMVARPL
jgi:hypothetical protein